MPFELLFAGDGLASATSDEAWVAAMCRAEAALARACAGAGVIPLAAVEAVVEACEPSRYDAAEIMRAGRAVANPAQPLVERLREQAGEHVHVGATSQDIVDTALMLIARGARSAVLTNLDAIAAECAALADEHRRTPMMARTLLQQALPTTFGVKAAQWLVGVVEARRALAAVELAVQLGGAVGALGAYGDKGLDVLKRFAQELDLAEPTLPWHTNRLRVAALAAALAAAAGAVAKIAYDLILLAQTEVAEVTVPSGGSSAMAHKRNPALAVVAVAAAREARVDVDLVHEHERAAGAWQAEWPALSRALASTGGATQAVRETLAALTVDAARMRANLDPELGDPSPVGDALVDRALAFYRHG